MEPPSFASDRYRCLSGSALKVIAVLAMLVDHVTKRILIYYPTFVRPLFFVGDLPVSWAYIGETIGRIAFPIYCFLLVEGFVHTHDRRRYGRNLLVFALISEVPFDLARTLTPFDPTYQNVFVTLFLSYLGLCALESFGERRALQAFCVLGLALASMTLLCDYGPRGYAMVLMLYALRDKPLEKTSLGCCITNATWRAGLAFVPINLYDGERGFVRGPMLKYAFYAFYPLHILVLWRLRLALGLY